MTLENLNTLSKTLLEEELSRCCGAREWVNGMLEKFPFSSHEDLYRSADEVWECCSQDAWLEAFTHHPKIGDIKSLEKKFASTATWSEGEQKGVNTATQATLQALAQGNTDYENKFGYIFIVCATGKSAQEMLALLQARLPNDPKDEIHIAMKEQQKITKIRLEKLLS